MNEFEEAKYAHDLERFAPGGNRIPEIFRVDDIVIDKWYELANRLSISEDLVHEIDIAVRCVWLRQGEPCVSEKPQAGDINRRYPVEAAMLKWCHDMVWHHRRKVTLGPFRERLARLRAEHAPPAEPTDLLELLATMGGAR